LVAGPGRLRYTLCRSENPSTYDMLTITEEHITDSDSNGESSDVYRLVLGVVDRLANEEALEAYLVGGPVRDRLLGIPATDLDITVVGDAPRMAERLASQFGGRLTVHHRFGTATVDAAGVTIDLVTARRETYRSAGALPDVQPGDIEDDLARRDFTINAMAIPVAGHESDLVDLHGGKRDLAAGLVRVLHELSFRDDPTRMLRAVRYAARFEFDIEPETADLMASALASGAMSTLTGDRLRHELARILQEPDPAATLRRADEAGVLRAIHPSLSAAHLPATSAMPHGPLTWVAALAWPLSAAEAGSLTARLNAPSDWERVISDAVRVRRLSPQLSDPRTDAVRPSEVCGLLDGLAPDALRAAMMLAPTPAANRIDRYLGEWWTVAPRLRGDDVLALGVPAGPAVGEALRALRRARLDGVTRSRADEEEMARQWAEQPNNTAC